MISAKAMGTFLRVRRPEWAKVSHAQLAGSSDNEGRDPSHEVPIHKTAVRRIGATTALSPP